MKKFHIYIPSYKKYSGGPNTFMINLQKYLDRIGYPYTDNTHKSSSIFFPIQYNLKSIKKIKSKGGKVIQRLDGIYYSEKHGDGYLKMNELIKEIYLDFADYITFQSDYSRKQCFDMFGKKR